ALVLGGLVGVDPRDGATASSAGRFFLDYTPFLTAHGLVGARIGVARTSGFDKSPKTDTIIEEAVTALRDAGATVVDPANIPTQEQLGRPVETAVLLYDFKNDLNAYLATRTGVPVRSLADAIAFNEAHAAEELKWFGQDRFEDAEAKGPLTEPEYLEALQQSHSLSREQGIDAVMDEFQLDALVAPTAGPAWVTDLVDGDHHITASSTPAAPAGHPI